MATIRRQRAISRAAISLAAALALLAAACGSGDGETEASATSSPLAEFLGQGDLVNDPEAAQARFVEAERARQEVIAECMQAQGFEYTPVDPSQFMSFASPMEDYGSDEWTAKWGLGITTMRFSQDQVGPDLIGFDESAFGPEVDFVDPNQEYVESLSESERQAYYEAMSGVDSFGPAVMDESMSEEEMQAQMEDFEWEPQGCEGEAYRQNDSSIQSFYIEFEDELQEMYERMEADPRVEERRQGIVDCVADKGIEYQSMEKVYEHFENEMQEIDATIDWDAGMPELTEEEMDQLSETELQELFAPPELSDEAKAKLGDLQAEEIELAMALNECGGGPEAEYEQMADIRAEYEREFLDANADELEQYRAT